MEVEGVGDGAGVRRLRSPSLTEGPLDAEGVGDCAGVRRARSPVARLTPDRSGASVLASIKLPLPASGELHGPGVNEKPWAATEPATAVPLTGVLLTALQLGGVLMVVKTITLAPAP